MNSLKINVISVFSKMNVKINNCIGITATQPSNNNNNTIKKPNIIVPL